MDDIFERVADEGVIDFLSLDVEGHELHVLDSISWHKWNVRLVLTEVDASGKEPLEREEAYRQMVEYMKARGYRLVVGFEPDSRSHTDLLFRKLPLELSNPRCDLPVFWEREKIRNGWDGTDGIPIGWDSGSVQTFESDCPILVASVRLEQSLNYFVQASKGNFLFYSNREAATAPRKLRDPSGELVYATNWLWLQSVDFALVLRCEIVQLALLFRGRFVVSERES